MADNGPMNEAQEAARQRLKLSNPQLYYEGMKLEARERMRKKNPKQYEKLIAEENAEKEMNRPKINPPSQPLIPVISESSNVIMTTLNFSNAKKKVTVQLELTEESRILAKIIPPDSFVVSFCKNKFKNAQIHGLGGVIIDWPDHKNFIDNVAPFLPQYNITFDDLPKFVVELYIQDKKKKHQSKEEIITSCEELVEPHLLAKMFPFQKEGLYYGVSKEGRCLICDEMGLGKSIQGLAIARYYRCEWPLLIVCPKTVHYSWRDTFSTFLPEYDMSKVFIIEKKSDTLPYDRSNQNVIIVSYTLLDHISSEFHRVGANVVIFDESHCLKNASAVRTAAAKKISRVCGRRILMSGTPALSRPEELHSQLDIIDSKLTPRFHTYGARYCNGKTGKYGFDTSGSSHPVELAALLNKFFMIRRKKSDVLKDLPEKLVKVHYLRGPRVDESMKRLSKEAKELSSIKSKFENSATKSEKESEANLNIMEYYRLTGQLKAKLTSEYVFDTYFDEDVERRKIIIFAHHRCVLDEYEAQCAKKRIGYMRIDGQVVGPKREEAINKFQTDPECYMAILSITAANAGITLTASSTVIFAELHWNPGFLQQAENRVHRIGQKNFVNIIYIVCENTADDHIFPLIKSKMEILGQLTLNSSDFKDSATSVTNCTNQTKLTKFFAKLTNTENENSVSDRYVIDNKRIKDPDQNDEPALKKPRNY
uniref:SWI/SNF-related matrix-associated actin-dependent regulator of chromatin subfamily A-like protein 1 n=1 Tax=Rhabditophanes sp. KR3021 TaxID=114890 RepID=A0AC35U491_9BILA